MKHIEKRKEPAELIEFKARENKDWKPSFDKLDRLTKQNLKKALLTEQSFLCCYCEARVNADNSHIEHFVPQSHDRSKSLNYNNLMVSCQKEASRGDPRHCGKRKDHDPGCNYDCDLLINPTDPTCEKFFGYHGNGHIFPMDTLSKADQRKAHYTINALGLDIPKVTRNRRAAIETILEQMEKLNRSQRNELVQKLLQKPKDERCLPYFTTIRCLFSESRINGIDT